MPCGSGMLRRRAGPSIDLRSRAAESRVRRPFLLLQARNPGDPMLEHERLCFLRGLELEPEDLFTVNAVERLPTAEELAACAGVLIGGSGDYSVLDPHRWIADLVAFTRDDLVLRGKPTFASCFGFQILVLSIGGAMVRDPARSEVGTFDLALEGAARDDPIFSNLPAIFRAQVGHNDRATVLPSGVQPLASSALCPLHAFRVHSLPIWATQFHPELDQATMKDRFRRYRALYGSPDPEADELFLASLQPSEEASLLLLLFARWVAAHDEELARLGI